MTSRTDFERLRDQDKRNETRIFWSEIVVIAVVALAVGAYFVMS